MRYVFALLAILSFGGLRAAETRPNVLFISIDDLRPQLGCYGLDFMVTPNLDKFASRARVFKRQFVQAPTCGASRHALLTGRYPRRLADLKNEALLTRQEDKSGGTVTLPELFRQSGYYTVGLGKISHSPNGMIKEKVEIPGAWDEMWGPAGIWGTSENAFFAYAGGKTRVRSESPPTERGEVSDDGYPDWLIASEAIERLRGMKEKQQPFFLAVGFFKPHLPFSSPARYWDLYDREKIPVPAHTQPPEGTTLKPTGEVAGFYGGWREKGKVSLDEGKLLRQAYCAAVSYVDGQVGRLLDELEKSGLADNTIVVVWGDHGWHLGELGAWGKHTLMDAALRSTLMIRMPGQKKPGAATDDIVEAVDIYPTLAALCDLDPPKGLDGKPLVAQLESLAPASRPALSFWQRNGSIGRSIRTDHWRYTEWDEGRAGCELYDQIADPDESANLAGNPDYQSVMDELHAEIARRAPPWQAGPAPSSAGGE